jgi:pyridinium-3,5-bisthiocarboxylic acid mononucleotide nickel chelatase
MLAYFDCFSGISGDMTLGALIDLGVPSAWVKEMVSKLPLAGFDIRESSVSRNGIYAKRIDVVVDESQPRRDYREIKELIEKGALSDRVRCISLDILERIAVAESRIHNTPKDHVHFHEVGGVDAIVDIVGTALCVEYLNIGRVVSSKIPHGTGFADSMHGIIPIPAPATLAILQGVPTYGTGIPFELVTPTGAAIITALADSFDIMPEMNTEKVGYGSGQRILESRPNLLRVVLGKDLSASEKYTGLLEDDIIVIETNIDDMNPEWFGYVMDRLQEDGALDVCWIPVQMKKNRPGTLVQVLCRGERKEAMLKMLLTETTSLGVRIYEAHRYLLEREARIISTPCGDIQVKRIKNPDGTFRIVPEFDSCKKVAMEKKIPIRSVYDMAAKAFCP